MKSLKGHLLIAAPDLTDPNFFKKVVLLIQHNGDGAFGIVLNGPIARTIREVWEEVGALPADCDEPVNLGGPVQGPLMAIHTRESLADAPLLPGVYFSMEKNKLEQLVAEGSQPFRVFAGCAGWAAGQLEMELEEGAWLTLPATADYVFFVGDDLWATALAQVGGYSFSEVLHVKHIPADVTWN